MRKKGLTLVEILVVLALVSLLSTLAFGFIGKLVRLSLRGLTQTEMQQQAIVTFSRLRQMLQGCSNDSVSVATTPLVIGVNSLEPGPQGEVMDNAGNLRWRRAVDVVFQDGQRLLWRRWPQGPSLSGDPSDPDLLARLAQSGSVLRLTPTQLHQVANPLGPCQSLASDLEAFTLAQSDSSGALLQPLRLTLTFRRGEVTRSFTSSFFVAGSS